MKKNKIKKIVIRILAGVTLAALVVVNVQIGLTDGNSSDISLDGISMSIFTPAVAATGVCPTCPSPDELILERYDCPNDYVATKCVYGGSYCDISSQIPCP